MERIHYASGSILTGTAIARALLEYAEALAEKNESATVDIPTRREDGSTGRANFLIGPSSQIVSDTEQSEFQELVDDDLVASFVESTRKLRHVNIVLPDAGYTAESADDLDVEYPGSE
ncbi:MAG: hypothetical protein JWQ19_64 [Subtercola sp.]|nr:hypothetical protein [Subtercola sp.]